MDCPDELAPFENATELAVLSQYPGRSTADLEEGIQPCDPIWQLFPDSSSIQIIYPLVADLPTYAYEWPYTIV